MVEKLWLPLVETAAVSVKEDDMFETLALLATTWWPYIGALNVICAIIGYLLAGAVGLLLGLLLGPIGLLISLFLRRPATV